MSACLLCAAPLGAENFPYGTRFDGQSYRYLRCTRCGSATINPLPTPAQLATMYAQGSYHEIHYQDPDEEVTESRLPYLGGMLRSGGRLLDIGCGNGHLVKSAQTLGYAAEGTELDPETRAVAARNSCRPVRSLEEVEASGDKFDIIHLGDVLEHLTDPAGMMLRLEKLLAPDGLFFVEGPLEEGTSFVNMAARLFGRGKKLLGRKTIGDYPPYHVFRTGAAAQRAFFEQRLGHEVCHYDVFENGWPYLATGPARSTGARIRDLIARAAITSSRAARRVCLPLGNRFAAVTRPPAVASR